MLAESVAITFLDRPRHLRFDVAACRALYETTGREIYDALPGSWGPGAVSLFLWAGLAWEDPTLSKLHVDRMVERLLLDGHSVGLASAAIEEALEKSGIFTALRGHAENPHSGGGSRAAGPSSSVATDTTSREPIG